jgi:ribosome-binding factor A
MSRRTDRVNELLRREIGNVIQKDYEWHGKLVTVNEVEITQDLKEGRVWIGVLGGEAAPVLEKLNRDHGSIQGKVMRRVVLKSTPVLQFRHDASAIRGVEIVNLLDEVEKLPKAPED